jgi:ABC-type polysaccharide/polyol phosphate export permease
MNFYDSAHQTRSFFAEFIILLRYRELVRQMVARSIKTRYKRSVLGIAWTLLNPLLTAAVLTIVFSTLFRFQVEHYPVYILSGLLAWSFFTSTTDQAMGEMLWSSHLMQRIYLPKALFVITATGAGLVNMALSLIPLLLIMLITGASISPALLFLPISAFLLTLFTMGIGFLLSSIVVYFQDIQPIYQVILMIGMYATPIIYPAEIVPERWQWLLHLNPMYYFLDCFRAPIFGSTLPTFETIGIATAISVATLLIGWAFFTRKADDYAYRT